MGHNAAGRVSSFRFRIKQRVKLCIRFNVKNRLWLSH